MNLIDLLYTVLLGILEGVTEFLPISSTGHLIVAATALNFPPAGYREAFEIFIQIGAIFAVVVYFGRDLLTQARALPTDRAVARFWLNIVIAFIPAAIVGFLLRHVIDEWQKHPAIVAGSLLVGGLVFLWIERNPNREARIAARTDGRTDAEPVKNPTIAPAIAQQLSLITPVQAALIGVAQITSLVPGVSRSGASIVGGLLVRLDRATATRFSFYLAIPTLTVATVYKLLSAIQDGKVGMAQAPVFIVGTVVSFIVALISIGWLLRYVATNNFRAFGVYRIIAGIALFVLIALQFLPA